MSETTRGKARKLLGRAAEHIERYGILYNRWTEPDFEGITGLTVLPCGCVVGTIRMMGGADPDQALVPAEIEEAVTLLEQATWKERKALAVARDGTHDVPPIELVLWSDEHADKEAVWAEDGSWGLKTHTDSNRAHVVATLRAVSEAPEEVRPRW